MGCYYSKQTIEDKHIDIVNEKYKEMQELKNKKVDSLKEHRETIDKLSAQRHSTIETLISNERLFLEQEKKEVGKFYQLQYDNSRNDLKKNEELLSQLITNNNLIKETFKKYNDDFKKLFEENNALRKENEQIKESIKKINPAKTNEVEADHISNDELKTLKENIMNLEASNKIIFDEFTNMKQNINLIVKKKILDDFFNTVIKKEENLDLALQKEEKLINIFNNENIELFNHFNSYFNEHFNEKKAEKLKFQLFADRHLNSLLKPNNLNPGFEEESEKELYQFLLKYIIS